MCIQPGEDFHLLPSLGDHSYRIIIHRIPKEIMRIITANKEPHNAEVLISNLCLQLVMNLNSILVHSFGKDVGVRDSGDVCDGEDVRDHGVRGRVGGEVVRESDVVSPD